VTDFAAEVEQWRELVAERAGEMPVDALLAWIAEESGGNPCADGLVAGTFSIEAGIFQTYFENVHSQVGGVTSADLRAACGADPHNQRPLRELTDDEKTAQVAAGIADAARSLDTARAQLLAASLEWTEPEQWCLAKLQHGLPAIPAMLLRPAAETQHAQTWRAWWLWLGGLNESQVAHLAPVVVKFGMHHEQDGSWRWVGLGRFAKNAETVGCAVGPLP
jgi:hypothetical protein